MIVIALSTGCVSVPAWERGSLAHASMDPADAPSGAQNDFVIHCFDVREGATGGSGRAGGGCGCN